jgi:SAM-dependent methyltransferase
MSMTSADDHIAAVYAATGREDLIAKYNDWAITYDADMQSVGYDHLPVVAGLVSRYVTDPTAAILDAGVGTGRLGHILNILGFSNLLGLDMSDGMLAVARARGVYNDLRNGTLGEPLDYADETLTAIVSSGTFTTGHAPATAFSELLRITKPGGYLIFTVATTVWQAQGFQTVFEVFENTGVATLTAQTPVYRPMPNSPRESSVLTRAYVYRKV